MMKVALKQVQILMDVSAKAGFIQRVFNNNVKGENLTPQISMMNLLIETGNHLKIMKRMN